MEQTTALAAAARNAMVHAVGLTADDRVLVVGDEATASCAAAFARGAADLGCAVTTYHLPEADRPLTAVPADLPAQLTGTTVVINAIAGDAREVPFRIEWIKAIEATGRIRLGHSPGIDADMMVGGALDVDYARMQREATALRAAFADTVSLHVTGAAGTDLQLDVAGRPFIDDLRATTETGVNLPCGEIYCAPVETGAEGILVVDSCIGSCGPTPSPLTLTVAGGQVTDVAGADRDTVALVCGWLDTDAAARTIAELGIGLNRGARLTTRMLEAEKVQGTAHVAFGSNEGFPGGRSRSQMHVDYLFRRPSIVATTADGGSRTVIADGRFVLD